MATSPMLISVTAIEPRKVPPVAPLLLPAKFEGAQNCSS